MLSGRRRALMVDPFGKKKRLYIFKYGDQCVSATGGWQEKGFYKNATGTYARVDSDCLNLGKNQNIAANYAKTLSTNYKIDFSQYSILVLEYESFCNTQSSFVRNAWAYLPDTLANTTSQAGAFGSDYASNRVYLGAYNNTAERKISTVNISELPRKNAYVSINIDAWGTSGEKARDSFLKIYNLYFEE